MEDDQKAINKISNFKDIILNWTGIIAPLLYILGIIVITVLAIYPLFPGEQPGNKGSQQNPTHAREQSDKQAANKQQDTLTGLVVEPVLRSDVNQFLFRILFWLFVWTMVFLVIPVGLLPLRRFKFLNLEFEVGKAQTRQAINQFVNNSRAKAKIIKNITSEDTAFRLIHYQHNDVPFNDILKKLLEEISLAYQDINEEFSVTVGTGKNYGGLSNLESNLILQSEASREPYTYSGTNKEPNYLAYFYTRFEDETYYCLLKSMKSEFDPTDKYVIESFFNVVTKYVEANEYMLDQVSDKHEGA